MTYHPPPPPYLYSWGRGEGYNIQYSICLVAIKCMPEKINRRSFHDINKATFPTIITV